MRILLMSLATFIWLAAIGFAQGNIPMNGSCTVNYNSDGSANLVCTTSAVVPPAPVSVTISPTSATVDASGTQQFTATVIGTGNQAVTWSAAGAGTVSSSGLFTASNTPGSATVTATSVVYPAQFASATVTVVNAPTLISIAVAPTNPSIGIGSHQQFMATGDYSDGSHHDLTNSVTWNSSNTNVASISSSGLANAVSLGTSVMSATLGSVQGTTGLTVTNASTLSRVPERICQAENETSTSSSCTLPSGIPAGDGVVVFVTSPNQQNLASNALQDSVGNTYAQLAGPVTGGYGSVYMWYSQLLTALGAGNTITLTVPGASSWGLSIYDIGPVQSSQPDVGVSFRNGYVGLPGVNNPATGVPGWWTGQTAATTGTSDACLAGIGVGSVGDTGAPAPIPSFAADHNFTLLNATQDYAQSDPNYVNGGSLLVAYAEAPAGSSVQSDITGSNPNNAPAVLYCFTEGAGPVVQTPHFTGNYCTGTGSCTLNNVTAGDMLIIGAHTFNGLPATPMVVSDTQNETTVFDQINGVTGLVTWHIAPVGNAGSHTITVNDPADSNLLIVVSEISGAATGNPVEAAAQTSVSSTNLGIANLNTSTSNDLLYAWGRASSGTAEGEGFNAVRTAPTAEYTIAPSVGEQTVTILPRPPLPATTVGVQAMAVRPAGTDPPPVMGPSFTGNYSYCLHVTSCTINNVAAGDMLVLSFFWWGQAGDAPTATDNLGETVILDRGNDTDGNVDLGLWHIGNVANPGPHTLSIGNLPNHGPVVMMISEYSGQSASNPIDAVTGLHGSGTTADTSVQTSQGNDLVYVACTSPTGAEAADDYAVIGSGPTVAFRPATPTPGTEPVACPLVGNATTWVIQELAIKH